MRIKEYQNWKNIFEAKAKKPGYYKWAKLKDSIYRKQRNGNWQVKRPGASGFQDLTVGDVDSREKNLESGAIPVKLNLLFVGDSNTASAAGGKFYGWWVQQQLGSEKVSIERVAKGGEGTQWMIDNLTQHLSSKTNGYYDIISILGGSNDIWGGQNFDYTKTRVEALVKMAEDHGARAVVVSPPSKEFYPAVVAKESDAMKKLAELSKLVKWEVDTYGDNFVNFNWLTSPAGGATVADFEQDARHLKPQPKHEELAKRWVEKIYWGAGPA